MPAHAFQRGVAFLVQDRASVRPHRAEAVLQCHELGRKAECVVIREILAVAQADRDTLTVGIFDEKTDQPLQKSVESLRLIGKAQHLYQNIAIPGVAAVEQR